MIKKPEQRKTGPIWGTWDWLTDGANRIRAWRDDLNPLLSRIGSSISTFLLLIGGAYLSPEIRSVVDGTMSFLGGVVITQASIQTSLIGLVLALVTYQILVTREIRNTVDDDSPTPKTDGGDEQEREFKTDGKGAVTGAIAGAAIGSLFGPGGTIGGLLGGAIMGDEIQRRNEEKRRAREEVTHGLVDEDGERVGLIDERGEDET